jgi:hypothetical protein
MQGPRDQLAAASEKLRNPSGDAEAGSRAAPKRETGFGVERLLLTLLPCTLNRNGFRNSTHGLS